MECNEIIYGPLLPFYPPGWLWDCQLGVGKGGSMEKRVKLVLWPHQLLLVPFRPRCLSHLVLSSLSFTPRRRPTPTPLPFKACPFYVHISSHPNSTI